MDYSNNLEYQISRLEYEIKLITESSQKKLKRRRELVELIHRLTEDNINKKKEYLDEIHRLNYEIDIATDSIVKRRKDIVELKQLQNKLNKNN